VHVIVAASTATTFVQVFPPIVTAFELGDNTKFTPWMVTAVPPMNGPTVGEMLFTLTMLGVTFCSGPPPP
jgi:hypothetical protein